MKNELYFIPNEGLSAAEIRSFDWTTTPLGSPTSWPVPLKTAVQLMLASRFPKAIIWGDDYTTLYNDGFKDILGDKEDCMGKSFRDIWGEVWADIKPMVDDAYNGKATFIEDFPLIINRFGYPEQCYFTFCYSPIMDVDGRVLGMMDTVIEMTGKVEAVQNATIVNTELTHRIKNTFSVVQALANQTFRKRSSDEALPIFIKRLHALSKGNDVLRFGDASNGSFSQVISVVLDNLGVRDSVSLEGEEISIGPKAVMSTSLLINELTTNALKYGALSVPEGRVSLSWNILLENETKTLKLEWLERGGPAVIAPRNKGFGSRLIKLGLMGIGASEISYDAEGLRAEFRAPFCLMQEEGRIYTPARTSL